MIVFRIHAVSGRFNRYIFVFLRKQRLFGKRPDRPKLKFKRLVHRFGGI